MPDVARPRESWRRPVIEADAAAAGMVLFALFVRSGWPGAVASACGLAVAAAAMYHTFRAEPSAAVVLGLSRPSGKVGGYVGLGCLTGAALGVLFRIVSDIGAVPAGLGRFVFVAVLIGATEEVVFRGYVQGRLGRLGWPAAVVLAAAAHTAYKSALFAMPPEGVAIDHAFLATWTLIGGVVFGLMRQGSGSVLPPLVVHAVFDIIVYGDGAQAPWWVWG